MTKRERQALEQRLERIVAKLVVAMGETSAYMGELIEVLMQEAGDIRRRLQEKE